MVKPYRSNLFALILGAGLALLGTIADSVSVVAQRVTELIEVPVEAAVRVIVASAHAGKARAVHVVRSMRSAVVNFAANHVVMLRCKGPATA